MLTFTISLDPDAKQSEATSLTTTSSPINTASFEIAVYEMGDVEDWLEWRKKLDRLLSLKQMNDNGPALFRHVRVLLAGEVLDKFNDICHTHTSEAGGGEETPEAFQLALKELTNSMLPPHTAKRVKRYLLEIQKPIFMSVSQFVIRLQQINSYFPYMPESGGQNAMLSTTDLKFVLEQAVPLAWRSALERSGQHEASTSNMLLLFIIVYIFDTLKK